MSGFFREREDGVELHVRLTPRSSKDAIEGVEQAADGRCHLAARVRAVPEKGEANAALESLLAAELGIPRKSIKVVAGGTSRLKMIRITGNTSALARMMAGLPTRRARALDNMHPARHTPVACARDVARIADSEGRRGMRKLVLALALAMPLHHAAAEEISSVYVETNTEKDCVVFDKAGADDGDYANMVCPGYRGYPVLVFAADLRESVFYGFPPADFIDVPWQSFETFNRNAAKAEWRVSSHDGKTIPFATIRRWYVQAEPAEGDKEIEVLVVAKVGQPGKADGCVVGLVLATGEPKANELARKIADEQARDFACGSDERVLVGDAMPVFYSEGKTKN